MKRSNKPGRDLSRRALIGAGIGAAAMPFAAWGGTGPDKLAEPGTEPGLPVGRSGRNLLTVGVLLDGRGPFQFVVDTGADTSILSDTVARQFGATGGKRVLVEGVVRTVEAHTVEIGSLEAGVATRKRLEMPILPARQLLADGYLGLDVINGYRLSMDFRLGELRLLERRSGYLIGPGSTAEVLVRLNGSNGHLHAIDCMIDGVRSVAFIDTGAEISVGNQKLFSLLSERDPSYVRNETVPLTGVTGGIIEGRVTTVKRIKLGGLDIDDSRIAIAGLQIFRLWEIEDRPALLIGMNWLRRFNRVTLDYGRKELRFDLAAAIRKEMPLRCVPGTSGCPYLLGSPNTIPRPSVAT